MQTRVYAILNDELSRVLFATTDKEKMEEILPNLKRDVISKTYTVDMEEEGKVFVVIEEDWSDLCQSGMVRTVVNIVGSESEAKALIISINKIDDLMGEYKEYTLA